MKHIFRYEVPVDDQPHVLRLYDDPVHVGCRVFNVVEFWAMATSEIEAAFPRTFIVVGTGHPIDFAHRYWGTAIAPAGQLVWHLLEVFPDAPPGAPHSGVGADLGHPPG